MHEETRELYKPVEVCKILNIKEGKLDDLCQKAFLDRINISTGSKRPTYRITKASVDNFLKTQCQ